MQLFFNGLVTGSIIACAAVGITLVYGVLKLVNFAGGDFLTTGAYVAAWLAISGGMSMFIAVPLSMLVVVILGITLDFLLWSKLRNRQAGQLSQFLAAVGTALILRQVLLFIFGAGVQKFPIDQTKTFKFFGLRAGIGQMSGLVFALSAIIIFAIVITRTSLGKQMRAYSDNPLLASVAGVNVSVIVIATWTINGLMGGLAGVLQGMTQGSFESQMGWSLLLPIFAAVVLGTIGDVYGALFGGLAIGLIMELSTWSGFFGGVSGAYKYLVAFIILTLVLLVKPQGLLGVKARSI